MRPAGLFNSQRPAAAEQRDVQHRHGPARGHQQSLTRRQRRWSTPSASSSSDAHAPAAASLRATLHAKKVHASRPRAFSSSCIFSRPNELPGRASLTSRPCFFSILKVYHFKRDRRRPACVCVGRAGGAHRHASRDGPMRRRDTTRPRTNAPSDAPT